MCSSGRDDREGRPCPQQILVASEKKFEFLIKSFETARQEIVERMKFREQLILAYLTGSIAFLGVAIANSTDLKVQVLCLVMPFVSIIVAARLSDNQKKIDSVGEFIRGRLNKELEDNNIWGPHWDWFTFEKRDENGRILEEQKARSLKTSNFLSVHLATVASIGVSAYYLWADWPEKGYDLTGIFLLVLTCAFLAVSFYYNWIAAFAKRKRAVDLAQRN